MALSHLRRGGPGGRQLMSAQSSVTTHGPPLACGDANYILGWKAEDFPIVVREDARRVIAWPKHPVGQEPAAGHPRPSPLRGAHPLDGVCNKRELLQGISLPTALERSKGNWESVVGELGGPGLGIARGIGQTGPWSSLGPSCERQCTR